ncbi:peptidoglycan DD-metalloendopeptidase family protein [Pseudomonas sp.]|uniref:peptidoglycan DD-metalloendopeptidase family protein n=1 Tax=Pseudomonas sp. TaxID=306 RepID=UPI0027318499|nr:peptidoglycan DD-metalloendopeptidase family protein [Pseudomonas sp.]MDP2244646.1 peptidoglycan DD-metalloendopeptidase family protein [Pseudomonas sp.]
MSFTAIQSRICRRGARSLLGALVTAALLAGCVSTQSGGVQVVDRDNRGGAVQQRQPVTSGQYVVRRGDTLYSIAFRFGWDWKALAARNGIAAPYLIRVGQAIRFDGRQSGSGAVVAVAPAVNRPASVARPIAPAARPQAQVSAPIKATPATTPVQSVQRSASGWAWPTNGVVIGRFSSNGSLNKGIDIAGDLGQPVLAASDGSVVYAGSGLRGYGELVIIKHSDTYVSAYGHNRRLLVQEGQQVKVGQSIAEMGSTGADRVKLHFEIRRQGKPVDPLQYLPRL